MRLGNLPQPETRVECKRSEQNPVQLDTPSDADLAKMLSTSQLQPAEVVELRWMNGDPPPLEEVLKTMRKRAAKFNVEKIEPQELAGTGGPADEEASNAMRAIRSDRYPMRSLNQGITSIRDAAVQDFVSLRRS